MKIRLFERGQWFYWLFARFFSKAMKRRIVMVAAFCEIERKRGMPYPRVRKLNRALKITQTDKLIFGIRDIATPFSEAIFCETSGDICDVATVCKKMAESVPSYMMYDTMETVVSDIAKVIVCNLK